MELLDYLRALRKRWWLILLCALVGLGGAAAATAQMPRLYQTTIQFQFTDAQGNNLNPVIAQQVASGQAPTYAALASSGPVLSYVKKSMQPQVPLGSVSVNGALETNTIFFDLTVTADSAEGAYALAKAFGTAFPQYLSSQFQGLTQASSSVGLKVFQEPAMPGAPVSPHPKRNDLIGLVLGLVLGIAGAFLAEGLDRSVRGVEDVERVTRLTVVAAIPVEHRGEHSVAARMPRSQRAEAVRQLRTNVQFAGVDHPIRTLLVTSAVAGEGKTTTAANLAITSAFSGQRVLLVDADLRRPGVADEMDVEGAVGLTNVLVGDALLEAAVQPWGPSSELDVLAAGPIPANPSELLGSQRMLELLKELVERYDLVVFDAPPLLPVTDAAVLSRALDGVILVTKIRSTPRDRLKRAADMLRRFDVRIVGVVCNWTAPTGDYYLPTNGRRGVFRRRRKRSDRARTRR